MSVWLRWGLLVFFVNVGVWTIAGQTAKPQLARRYMDELQAPRKEFVPIEGSHFVEFIHSDEFLKELLVRVAALAE